MKMIRNNYYAASLAFIAGILVSGCSRDLDWMGECTDRMGFSVSVEGCSDTGRTRAAEAGTDDIKTFMVIAYENDGSKFFNDYKEVKGDGATATTTILWGGTKVKRFYAYASKPDGAAIAPAYGHQTLSYIVPATAAEQTDLLLAACSYDATGKSTISVPLVFRHPLTEVKFKKGTMDVTAISAIRLKNVFKSGSVPQNYDGTFGNWTASTEESNFQTVSSSDLSVPFMLIPQTGEISVEIDATVAEVGDVTLSGKLNVDWTSSDAWKAGYAVEYIVNYSGSNDLQFETTLVSWKAAESPILAQMEEKQVGPDPDFWADLGLLSADGYPLYVSKRDVKGVSPSGDVTFMDNVGTGTSFKATEIPTRMTFKGKECQLFDIGVMHSIWMNSGYLPNPLVQLAQSNRDLSVSKGDTQIFIHDGNLFSNRAYYYGYSPSICGDRYDSDFSYLEGPIKLVYEDRSVPPIAISNFSYYGISTGGDMFIFYTRLGKITNNQIVRLECTSFRGYLALEFEDSRIMFFDELPESFSMELDNYPTFQLYGTRIYTHWSTPENTETKVTLSSKGESLSFIVAYTPCFVKGTLITLADGSRKPVEDLTYDDDLMVWDFDEGCYSSAKLLWITRKGLKTRSYYKTTLSDGSVINTVGPYGHRLCDVSKHKFIYAADIEIGDEVFTDHGVHRVVSCEIVYDEVEYYNLITKRHINCFADGVLTASHFNNVYPFDDDMRFIKDGRKIRPWSEFRKAFKEAGISRDWYEGVRLGEQPDSLDDVVLRLSRKETLALPRPEADRPTFFARIWNRIKSLFAKQRSY